MKVSELEVLIDRIVKAERLAEVRNNAIMDATRERNEASAKAHGYISAATVLSQKVNETDRLLTKCESDLESMYFLVIDLCEKVKAGAPLIAQDVESTIEQANNLRGTK